jgi:hypothetical protein
MLHDTSHDIAEKRSQKLMCNRITFVAQQLSRAVGQWNKYAVHRVSGVDVQ